VSHLLGPSQLAASMGGPAPRYLGDAPSAVLRRRPLWPL